MIGYSQKAWIKAERFCSRRSDTAEKPGAEWGPTFSAKRRYETESPRSVLPGKALHGEGVSTGGATVGGWLKKLTPLGKPVDMLT
jgi:hypothetical protein